MSEKNKKTYLITGSAGFIGFHTAKKLLETGQVVIGIDNLNDYYDVELKKARNSLLKQYSHYTFLEGDLGDLEFVKSIFVEYSIESICHLAAQAGVRYSLTNPYTYINSNIIGFTNLINEAKNAGVLDFVYASSSSVYGKQQTVPFSESMSTDEPLSLYAATKKANEAIAYTYHHLYGMRCTGLRFFTVYGPWGRPDMAIFSFTKAIIEGTTIQVFNNGRMLRDFTYIDDIVAGIIGSLEHMHEFALINLGNNKPVELSYMISTLENTIGTEAKKEFLPMQPGDMLETYADIRLAQEKLGWTPQTLLEDGIRAFVDWYKGYFK